MNAIKFLWYKIKSSTLWILFLVSIFVFLFGALIESPSLLVLSAYALAIACGWLVAKLIWSLLCNMLSDISKEYNSWKKQIEAEKE